MTIRRNAYQSVLRETTSKEPAAVRSGRVACDTANTLCRLNRRRIHRPHLTPCALRVVKVREVTGVAIGALDSPSQSKEADRRVVG